MKLIKRRYVNWTQKFKEEPWLRIGLTLPKDESHMLTVGHIWCWHHGWTMLALAEHGLAIDKGHGALDSWKFIELGYMEVFTARVCCSSILESFFVFPLVDN